MVLDEAPQASSPSPEVSTTTAQESQSKRVCVCTYITYSNTNESNAHKTLRVTDPGDVTRLSPAVTEEPQLSDQPT